MNSACLERLRGNLARVREQIAAAAARCGRAPASITLVAVTKTVSADVARLLPQTGILDLGESRPQDLWRKAPLLHDLPVRWHLVGHLQRNKVARTLPLVSLIHSVDSLRLLAAIESAAAIQQSPADVLLEVNVSGQPQKHGFAPDAVAEALQQAATCRWLRLRGLMAMAGTPGDLAAARREFASLRELRDRLREAAGGACLDELSMGMSGDFEAAIEEGATMVRIGTALFEGIA
ncbi:MAG: YggS family pyridoxal phosphate-dependent enzyme [Pirellulales bacterium]|nr:YggS family pyridoxal phosphate-dependent enzyme [Pirellulales bacterium]